MAPLTSMQTIASPAIDARLTSFNLDRALFFGLLGLLLFGPLAFGAVEPWSIFVLQAGAACLFVLWTIRQVMSSEMVIAGNALFPPLLAFAGLVLVQIVGKITAYRYATFSQALLYCAYGLIAFLVVQCLRRTRQIKILTIVLSAYGSLLALFALFQSIVPNGKIYWLRPLHSGGWIYGPYVNHNHYAGLMEMLMPIPLVFAFTHYARGQRKILAAVAAVIMASTIFLSGSRGGMLAFGVQISILAAVLVRRTATKQKALALGCFLVAVIGLLAWLGGGELTKRMASIDTETRTELSGGIRLNITHDSLRMFAHRPILGWGLGVFEDVYPQFRSFYTNSLVDEAHNDYAQFLVEMGALGFGVMLWYVVVLYRKAAKKLHNWTHDTNGAVALATMLGCTGILVHSFVDFNLQIPANALLFYVFGIIAVMEPRFSVVRKRLGEPQAAFSEIPAQF